MPRQRPGVLREAGEYLLGHIARPMDIAAGATQCGRINQIDVAMHQLRERRFRPVVGIGTQERGVIVHRFTF